MARKNKKIVLENLLLSSYAAEGKAIGRVEGKVIFVEGAVPGDIVHVLLTKSKKDWAEGRVIQMVSPSKERVEPFCRHFGVCGGCKWQMLPYEKQLEYKQQEAEQNLLRIGKLENIEILPIAGANATTQYRNKLEFTASNKEYLISLPDKNESLQTLPPQEDVFRKGALGYHVPRIFDKVVDIFECHLMDDVNNLVRNTVREFAIENKIELYDIRQHTGWLRNVIVRYTTTGELMVNIVINHEDVSLRTALLNYLIDKVPAITTLLYTINPKWNDSIYDLEPITYKGSGYITERLGDYEFIISPKSFFQTNSLQAEVLYTIATEFAGLTGKEIVYDLYCGTGSIGIFMSKKAKKIIGVELIADAIEDAKKNAALNHISHAVFFAGDVIKICDDTFFETHGRPDVIITDPPRAGMHEKLVNKLLEIQAPRMVYVSCNIATQARDIALLSEKYRVVKAKPVDMFPHTHHIECVALLELK